MIKTFFVLFLLCTTAFATPKTKPRSNRQQLQERDGLLGGLLGGGGGLLGGGLLGGGLLGGVTDLVDDLLDDVGDLLEGVLNLVVGDCHGGILGILPNVLNLVVNDVAHLLHDVVNDVEILLDDVVGLVFAITNELLGNRLVVFPRLANGTIVGHGNYYATGGLGSGSTSQNHSNSHSIVVSSAGDRVYVCNPGSNSISVFAIISIHLKLIAVIDSGGEYPIALALSPDNSILYVLNAGGQGRLAAIDLSATLRLSVHLPGLLELNVGLALNLGLLGGSPVSVINLNQYGNSPSSSTPAPPRCNNITGVSDIVVSPDGRWIIIANKYTGSIICLALHAGLFLPVQLGLPVITNLLNLNLGLAVDLNLAGIDLDLALGVHLGIGPGINLGVALGVGVSIAPLSLSFIGASTLLVGVGGIVNGLVVFNLDLSTGHLVLVSNHTAPLGGAAGAGSAGGSGTGSIATGSGTYIAHHGNTVFVNPGFLGLGGLLAGVLNLVDGLLIVVDRVVDNLLDDVVVLVDHLLYNVVATVDGLIYTLGLGGLICGHKYDAASGHFIPCGCTQPDGLLQGLAVL